MTSPSDDHPSLPPQVPEFLLADDVVCPSCSGAVVVARAARRFACTTVGCSNASGSGMVPGYDLAKAKAAPQRQFGPEKPE